MIESELTVDQIVALCGLLFMGWCFGVFWVVFIFAETFKNSINNLLPKEEKHLAYDSFDVAIYVTFFVYFIPKTIIIRVIDFISKIIANGIIRRDDDIQENEDFTEHLIE